MEYVTRHRLLATSLCPTGNMLGVGKTGANGTLAVKLMLSGIGHGLFSLDNYFG